MSSSIEFGVLEEWSNVSLIPEYRVDLSEDEFRQLSPMLADISTITGMSFDLYSSAVIEAKSLDVFINEVSNAECNTIGTLKNKLQALLKSARLAQALGRPLQYRGL